MNALLIAVVAVPALGAGAAAVLGYLKKERAAAIAGTAFAALGLVLAALLALDHSGAPWSRVRTEWVPLLHLDFDLGVDGVSYPLVVLSGLLTLLCCAFTVWKKTDRPHLLIALLLIVDAGMLGVFLSLNLVLFFVFFEVVLLPMFAIIAGWGGANRRHAAVKFALYTLLGSLLLLVGIFVVVTGAETGDIIAITASGGGGLSRNTQLLAFVLLAVGLAIKAPLWPLHSWLPDAHTEAPTVGSVILAGVLLKMGTYGLIRVAVGVAPEGASRAALVLGVLAVVAILVAGLVCLAQTELKRLIAYSSVGHMGFVLLGIATLTPAGLTAALLGNIAHGLITGLLFFLAGAVKDRAHTGELARLGGLREVAPGLSGLLGFTALASLGLPGLAGFWGEAFAVYAAIQRHQALWTVLAVLAAIGAALAAAYLLRMLRLVTHGGTGEAVAAIARPGLARYEWASYTPLAAGALVLGLAPFLVQAPIAEAVTGILQAVAR
ncbi:NADH-quinone oxidoreductase subunit M [Actinorhabdospora filicis]|uniref:NADH-quinone oxidoreductase subunit M n=1 Tax=Actinorhabdospora filicis TaxID=1785913 RepID=A0A9W6SU48_9ACTN|nr:NADH-quinone oxidoreductase subunit M [Actinorhabdospora filicis]GLZ80786.1 NADH-quinone oxidoreductase subunit M [Actinorhabdospora filicis]